MAEPIPRKGCKKKDKQWHTKWSKHAPVKRELIGMPLYKEIKPPKAKTTFRTDSINGGEVEDIFNLPPNGCARRLWYRKKEVTPDHQTNIWQANAIQYLYNYHIIMARRAYDRTMKFVRSGMFPWRATCKEFPYMQSHPEWKNYIKNLKRKVEAVDIKLVRDRQFWEIKGDTIPDRWMLNAQHHIYVRHTDFGVVFVWNVDDCTYLPPFHVPRDEGLIKDILIREEMFWKNVTSNVPPDALAENDYRCGNCAWQLKCRPEIVERLSKNKVFRDKNVDLKYYIKAYHAVNDAIRADVETLVGLEAKIAELMGVNPKIRTDYATTAEVIDYNEIRWDTKGLMRDMPDVAAKYRKVAVKKKLLIRKPGEGIDAISGDDKDSM